jgi:hypothetical protein
MNGHQREKRTEMTQDASSADGSSTEAAAVTLESEAPAAAERSRRVLVVGLLVAILGLASVLVLLRVFVGQRIPELTEDRLAAAEEIWEHNDPASYDMEIEIRGARPGQVHIEVTGGKATAMTRDGRSPPPRTWNVWSVPGMFETLERELELALDPIHEMQAAAGTQLKLRCEFDPQFGFPRRYHRFVTGGGPEVFWEVTRFEPK